MTVSLTNFRSLGGYPVANGHIRDGLLFRGGQLDDLSGNQINYLQRDLKITRIIDFRSLDERKQFPDSLWQPVEYQPIDVLIDAKKNGVSIDGMIDNAGDITDVMLATYEQLVVSDSAREGYHQFLEELIEKPEPTFFHCFAGKDRTGVAAAIILKAAGADQQLIFDDYLRTNDARKAANAKIIQQLAPKLSVAQQHSLAQALVVEPDYLQRFFDTVHQKYGSFDGYLTTGLRLPADFSEKLRNLYVQ